MAKVRIKMTGPLTGKVWVDDVEQEHVVAFEASADVRDHSRMRVTITQAIYPAELELEAEVEVTELDNQGSRVFRAAQGA